MDLYHLNKPKKPKNHGEKKAMLQMVAFPVNLVFGGGLVLGKIYEWFGGEGCGKSTLAYETCALAAKQGVVPVFYDMEDATSLHRLAKFGLFCWQSMEEDLCTADQINMYLIQDVVSLEGIFVNFGNLIDDLKKVKPDVQTLVVIDSVGASPPQAHVDAKSVDQHLKVGADALGWKNMLRLFNRKYLPDLHSLILLNHQTMVINTGFGGGRGPKYTSPGGHAIKHQCHMRVQIIRVGSLKNSAGEQIGAEILIKTLKNREAPPFQEARVPLYFGNPDLAPSEDFVGTWDAMACLTYCRTKKLIANRGSKSSMWLLNDAQTEYEAIEWMGIQQFIDTIYSDDGYRRRLYATMRHAHYNSEAFSDGVIKPSGGPQTTIDYGDAAPVSGEEDEEEDE